LFYFFFYSIFSLICFNQLEQLLAVKRKGWGCDFLLWWVGLWWRVKCTWLKRFKKGGTSVHTMMGPWGKWNNPRDAQQLRLSP
jgi:hypothetical protein